MIEKILEAKKITKIYGFGTKNPVTGLNKVSLTVDAGDFVCIMGPSGSGKSTLINNLSTIDMPSSGTVYISGIEVKQMHEKQIGAFRYKNLGFIFQDFNLLNSLTIFENIAVPLSMSGIKINEITNKVNKIANKLGIVEILEKYPNDCSGGQKQRAAICRALITKPKLIVADEPTGNLDSKNSHELLSLFKELNETERVSILMVTHDPLIASYSSKLLYIKDGVIDNMIERKELSQKQYLSKIIEINSVESLKLFDE